MNNIFLFTGYDRTDLLEFFLKKQVKVIAMVIPENKKYIERMSNIFTCCINNSIPIISVKQLLFDPYIQCLPECILYSSGYPLIISKQIYSKFNYALNCHPSLLPRYRGKYLEYILINKEQISGTTLHHIDEGCDDGPIILQSSYSIEFTDRINDLLSKSYHHELLLLQKLIQDPAILSISLPQDNSLATCYLKSRTPSDSELDPSETLLDAYFKSRAFKNDLYPGYFVYRGYKVIFKMEVVRPD